WPYSSPSAQALTPTPIADGSYPPPYPLEPGLSSAHGPTIENAGFTRIQRLPGQLRPLYYPGDDQRFPGVNAVNEQGEPRFPPLPPSPTLCPPKLQSVTSGNLARFLRSNPGPA